ncbi:MAG: hypothetical protein K2X97_21180, partial [Mycobacteriaceae bacterium]|nr:hypothetical protein [Mycobacteriaceae bacterium]
MGSGATTLTAASAVVAFSVARTNALPSALVPTLKVAEVWPAAMTTLPGSVTTPDGAADSAMVVGVVCALEIVTVSGTAAPRITDEVGGSSDTSDAPADGVTVTLEVAREVPSVATTCAVPSASVPTLTDALSEPAGMLT